MERLIKSSDFGIEKYGYNADVDGAEAIWTGGGAFPWASVGANAATTIESADAADAAAGTGLRTVLIEGLVNTTIGGNTGGKIVRETATLNGTTAVSLTNEFAFVYRISALTVGSGGVNAGAISVKHSSTTIAHVLAGANNTEMAVMIVPTFTSEGVLIHGAWILGGYVYMAKNTTATANMVIKVAPDSNNAFSVKARATVAQTAPVQLDYGLPQYIKAGARVEIAAAAVSAADQEIAAGFSLRYD